MDMVKYIDEKRDKAIWNLSKGCFFDGNERSLQDILIFCKDRYISKEDIFNHLTVQGKTFDYALPQTWLYNFIKDTGLDYNWILSLTVWIYPENKPYSICKEIKEKF